MKIVVFSMPEHGHINSSIGIIEKLLLDRHEVIYFVDKNFENNIPNGCRKRFYSNSIDMERCKRSVNVIELSRNILITSNEILEYHYNEIKNLHPDVIMHDILCQWGKIFSKILSIPGVCFIPTFAFSQKEFPIIRVRDNGNIPKKEWNPIVTNEIISIKQDQEKKYRIVDSSLYISLKDTVIESLTNYEGLNIVFTSTYFHPNSDKYNNTYKFLGPCFTVRKSCNVKKEKLIYISFGTISHNRELLIQKCIDALGDTPYNVIISLSNSNQKIDNPYRNIQIVDFCDQKKILSIACLYIGHASINSINEACYYNTPFILTALQREQFVIADRIHDLGVAPIIKGDKLTEDSLRVQIDQVVNGKKYDEKFQILCNSLIAAGGPQKAVNVIYSYIDRLKK